MTDDDYKRVMSNGREVSSQEIKDMARTVDMSTAEGKRALVAFCSGVINSAASAIVASGMDPSQARGIAIMATKMGCLHGLTHWDHDTILKHVREFEE